MRRLLFPIFAFVALSSLLSCGRSDRYADSFILGDWQWQYPIIYDSVDYSKSWWDAHDAMCYRFLENGVYIEHGGPDALEPTKDCYEIIGDSLLHLYISSDMFYDESYKITSVSSDTIWLKANPSDKDHDWPLKMSGSKDISYLVRY